MKHKLLVTIVTYNAGDIITTCLNSINNQTLREFELCIIDNNSNDDTLHKIDSFLKKFPDFSKKLSILKNDHNVGFAKAVNQALKRVVTDDSFTAALLLNPDTEINNNLFSKGIEVLNQDAVGACSPLILYPDRRIWWIGTKILTKFELLTQWHYAISTHIQKGKPAPFDIKDSEVEAITGCSMFIKASAVRDVGLLDEKYFMYAEDLDYSLRLKSKGYKLQMFADYPIFHNVIDRRLGLKDRWKYMRKYKIYLTSIGRFINDYFSFFIFSVWFVKLPFALVYNHFKVQNHNEN